MSRRGCEIWRSWASAAALSVGLLLAILAAATLADIRDFPDGLDLASSVAVKPQVLARDGTPLNLSLQNAWNVTDAKKLEEVPPFLKEAFVLSEDRRFFEHSGVDWQARLAAVWQDLCALGAVRGASTITEQVVRMLHPRTRTSWSRWIEGFEAQHLESRFTKSQLLEFYLNQVPYAERRRGVVQAARYYYGRDLDTLTMTEMLSLVIFVRSPSGMDLRRNPQRLQRSIDKLADRMVSARKMSPADRLRMRAMPLEFSPRAMRFDAGYFVAHVLDSHRADARNHLSKVPSTLDPWVESRAQQILGASLDRLTRRKVRDGAVLVIDNAHNEILAWVVGRAHADTDDPGAQGFGYDTLLVPRQPGSTMKPLLYAMALERGWTAATIIDDSELAEGIGNGQHSFRNYSRVHYGPIRLREALGNSLNVPAVKTLKFVGGDQFLLRLHELGIDSLRRSSAFYGDGLALGNGEVSLYEMAQAYTVLARRGRYLPLTATADQNASRAERLVYSPEAASLIGDILSDQDARALEFGRGLQFPVQTAIKTGTSTDYRDAWAIAFDYAHTVAVWMGNLDDTPMDGVTGAIGPAMVARSIFSELNRNQETKGLWLSPKLVPAKICRKSGMAADGACETVTEWFVPGTLPTVNANTFAKAEYRLLQPTPGLQVARDPRIPKELEALPMAIANVPKLTRVQWYLDGDLVAETQSGKFAWPLQAGPHEVHARVWEAELSEPHATNSVRFYVR